jgi:HSP20 family protein
MTLIKWNRNPVDVMPGFSNLVDNFFSKDFVDFMQNETRGFVPAVNIKEEDNEFMIEVAAPGMQKQNFEISMDDKVLTISGNKEDTKEEKDDKYSRKEFSYTSFQRSFQLPDLVDGEKIEAHYQDGVLKINVPKRENAKMKATKRISIS